MSTSTTPQTSDNPLFKAHLRIARPTSSYEALLPFYVSGLGFHITSSFTKHDGFEGVMLGHPSLPYVMSRLPVMGSIAGHVLY